MGKLVITRGGVIRPAARFDRLIAALCAALMLFYAATVPAKAAGQLQHSPALMVAHDHGDGSAFTLDAVHDNAAEHADHHGAPADDEGTRGDHSVGGHHHHGDTGPNLLVPNAIIAAATAPPASLLGIGKDRRIVGLRHFGPERPPRLLSLTA